MNLRRVTMAPMRFWLLHSGDVPLQEQIIAQISLGILSGELAAGERLPSVRELGRRFHLHANTVSLAYRKLERQGWLECRRGSGMYVRTTPSQDSSAHANPDHAPTRQSPGSTQPGRPADSLLAAQVDLLLAALVRATRSAGLQPEEVRRRLDLALAQQIPHALLLVEPDPALARIVVAELRAALPLPIEVAMYPGGDRVMPATLLLPEPGILPLVLPSKAASLRAALPPGSPLHVLKIRSIPQALAPWLPAQRDALVGIASGWPPFLEFARTMLVAAGFAAEALLVRDASSVGWANGLEQAAAVVCDRYTATLLPRNVKLIAFSLLAEQTFEELHALLRPAPAG